MKNLILIFFTLCSNLSLASSRGGGGASIVPPSADEVPICSSISECQRYSKGGYLKKPKYRYPHGNLQRCVSQDLAAHACAHLNKRLPTIRELALKEMKKETNRINKNYPAVAVVEMQDFESGDSNKIPYGFDRKDFTLIVGLIPTHLPVMDRNSFDVKIDGFYYSNSNYKKSNVNLSYFSETSWVNWLNSQSELDARWPFQYSRVEHAYVFSVSTGDIWWTTAGLDLYTSNTGAFLCIKNVDEEHADWQTFPYVVRQKP